MKINKNLKVTTSILACVAIVTLGSHCYNVQLAKTLENNEQIIFNEVSSYETRYDFSDSEVLAEHSDLIVIGKVTNLGTPTNYNAKTGKYGTTRTPGTLEILQTIKSDDSDEKLKVDFMNIGGIISYSDYEKSLLPAQKAKRDYLMSQNGITTRAKSNALIRQSVENQLELEKDKTYIMYLEYNEDFDKYMVVSQPYGVKEYNVNTKKVLNHVTNEVESIEDLL